MDMNALTIDYATLVLEVVGRVDLLTKMCQAQRSYEFLNQIVHNDKTEYTGNGTVVVKIRVAVPDI